MSLRARASWSLVRWTLPVVLGFLFVLGDNLALHNGSIDFSLSLFVLLVLFSVLFVTCFFLVEKVLFGHCFDEPALKKETTLFRLRSEIVRLYSDFDCSRNAILKCFLTILICWIPYLVALYPGVYWSDTSSQLIQYYGGETLTDHHPLLATYVFGFFSALGDQLFGSASAGLFCLVVLQLLSVAFLFSLLIAQSRRRGTPFLACFCILVFISTFPFFPVMFSSLAKDTLSSVFFLAFVFCYIEGLDAIRDKSSLRTSLIVALTISGVFASLTKKTTAYVILLTLLVMFFVASERRFKLKIAFSAFVSFLIVFAIVPKIVLPALGGEKGGGQEAIATLIQQVAHDVKYDDGSMSESDKETIDSFLSIEYDDIASAYDFQIVDNVKGRSLENENLLDDFVILWAEKTIENPRGHFEAWLGLCHGWFGFSNKDLSPNYMVVCTSSEWYYEKVMDYVDWPIELSTGSRFARDLYDSLQSIPVINILFYRSFWASIAPAFILFVALGARKSKKLDLALISPLLISALTLLVVPVSGVGGEPTRYLLQLVIVAPFMLCHFARREKMGDLA